MGASLLFSRRSGECLLRYRRVLRCPTPAFFLVFRNGSKGYSSHPTSAQEAEHVEDPAARSLSSRMSFVFEQMDAIERERAEKDEAFRQIRAWREGRKREVPVDSSSSIPFATPEVETEPVMLESPPSEEREVLDAEVEREGLDVEVVHPWPEWIEFMERLLRQNYFDLQRKSEDRMVENISVNELRFTKEGFDFTRDWTTVRIACLNFGRDRFDILRSFSRKDIQILVGHGCPTIDSKVVFSAKLLRKYVHLDEGDVCSACSLRSSCERAYLLTLKEDEARTLDILRVLLTYGFHPIRGTVENKTIMKMKSVKTVVRKLLHEIVKLSAIPIDPNLPPPVIKKPPPKVKQPPPPSKKRVGRDDIEMKKGDWLCPKCDFMNFAKNTVCLQCDAKRPKRELLPGEWECPECNFLNYRRNMACFHCDHKRPHDEFIENQLLEKSQMQSPRTRLQRVAKLENVTNAWNFDFDDNESDGAEVAAFEHADPPRGRDKDVPLHEQTFPGVDAGFDDPFEATQMQRIQSKSKKCDQRQPSFGSEMGFDDFDEEEDDVDSYELDVSGGNINTEVSPASTSRMAAFSESDDFSETERVSKRNPSFRQPSRQAKRSVYEDTGVSSSGDEFSDDSDWSPDEITVSRRTSRNRVSSGGSSYDAEDEIMLGSDTDGKVEQAFRLNKKKRGFGKNALGGRLSDSEDEPSFRSNDEGFAQMRRNATGRYSRHRPSLNLKDTNDLRRGRRFSDFEDLGSDSEGESTATTWRNKTGRDRSRPFLNLKNKESSRRRNFSDSEDFRSDSDDENMTRKWRNKTGRGTRHRPSMSPNNIGNSRRRFPDSEGWSSFRSYSDDEDTAKTQRNRTGRETRGRSSLNAGRRFNGDDRGSGYVERRNSARSGDDAFGRRFNGNNRGAGYGERTNAPRSSGDAFGRRLSNRNDKPCNMGRMQGERSLNTRRGGFRESDHDFSRNYGRKIER